jgi:8-oxo-dGTP pyrophosphatase MutT (NUDIX family)
MNRHFTATVYVCHEGLVLLHRHAKLGKWLPPGGHMEPDETPPEAARREVKEETGLDIVFLEQENLKINAYNATSFERPFLCLLENIPQTPKQSAHQHMDMIYLATAAKVEQFDQIPKEFRWFSFEDLKEIEGELFPDTIEVLTLLFKGLTNACDAFLFR